MEKNLPKKPIFSTKDLPSSSTKNDSLPAKLRKKFKGKAQKPKKPYKQSERNMNSSNIPDKISPKFIEKEDLMKDDNNSDPCFQLILPFFLCKESYELTYISEMNFFLNSSGITEENYEQVISQREKFQSYTFYLKHTIFQEDEEIKKVRAFSFESKMQIALQNIEKANDLFKKEQYSQAVALYERVLGSFIWLEMKEPDANNPEYIEFKKSITRVIEHLKKQKEKGVEIDSIYLNLELEKNHKFLFNPITDNNVIFHEEIWTKIDETKKKKLNNVFFVIYLNIAACYLKMCNFYEVLAALEDAIKINDKNIVLYFQRSQALAYNKDSHLEDLYQAKIDLFQAREIMLYENKVKKNESSIFNEKIFVEYYKYLEERISERKKYEKILITALIQQAKDNKNSLKDKKNPIKPEEVPEYESALDLIGRYVRILEVSKEYKKNEKLNDYIKRYLEVKEVLSEMEFYFSLDFEDIEENEVLTELIKELKVNLKDSKMINALNAMKICKAQETYKKSNLNSDILTHFSLDELSPNPNKAENKEIDNENNAKSKPKLKWDYRDLFTCEGVVRILILLGLFWLFYYINRNNAMFYRVFFNIDINA